jgi:hypothetical protein
MLGGQAMFIKPSSPHFKETNMNSIPGQLEPQVFAYPMTLEIAAIFVLS